MLKFLIQVKPLDSPFLNGMELFNETILIVCFYFIIFFTDIIGDDELRYQLGWIYIGIIVINITVNFSAMLYKFVTTLI